MFIVNKEISVMGWKYSYLVEQIHRTAYKKHESYIVGSLLHDPRLSSIKPCTQHYVKRKDGGYALLDLFYPQINLAVEIDEPHHDGNKGNDDRRQGDVEKHLGCEFWRIEIAEGDVLGQIDDLKAFMLDKIRKVKRDGLWVSWTKPQRVSLDELKKVCECTLFLKIIGEIHPDELMARQTGYWKIAEAKRMAPRCFLWVAPIPQHDFFS